MVALDLHVDAWSNERPVLPFLRRVPPRQIGPDGALLLFSLKFMKLGKAPAFLRTEWRLELETKVRSMEVARWVLDRMSEVTDVEVLERDGRKLDEIGLALRIEDATKRMDPGPRSDPPDDEADDGDPAGTG